MKLRRLTLHGFKSFADRTELHFHEGVTAIVGPNGSGKSNISDAVRWVLGEQRASAIRSSRMDEAIFQGTAERHRLNRAEVGLGFSNEDRRLALPYDEVEIRRTVFREGGSEYEMNRQQCRLRDILDACRDTGLGTNAYSIIEQGMVDAILSDRNEDRRNLFEEAAGIGRYKDRRGAAERRLEAARADLARLDDIVSEVESKVRALARQRRRAERYGRLRGRRLSVEIALARHDLGELEAELGRLADGLGRLADDDPAARGALGTAEADLERRRLAASEAARTRNAAASRLEEANRGIADRERELAVARERKAHAEQRLRQIAAERAELLARLTTLESEGSELQAEREAQQAETARLAVRLDQVQTRLAERRQALVDARQEDEQLRAREEDLARKLTRTQAEAAGAAARVSELQRRLERMDREREELEGERVRLDEQGDLFASRAREIAATMTELETQRDQAASRLEEGRSGEAAARRAVLEAEDHAGLLAARLAALETLEREFHGFAPAVAAALTRRDEVDGLLGPLAEFLELGESGGNVEAALTSLLQILVVRDEAAAARVRTVLESIEDEDEAPSGTVALLRLEAVGHVRTLLKRLEFAGRAADEPVLLGRRARIAALRTETEGARQAVVERRVEREAASARLDDAERKLRTVEEQLREADLELRRAHADEAARAGRYDQVERTREELEKQRRQIVQGEDRVRKESGKARLRQDELTAALEAMRKDRRAAVKLVAEREVAWDAVREEEAEVRVLHARAESSLGAIERRLAAATDGMEHAAARLEGLGTEEAEHTDALERVATLDTESESVLETLFATRERLAEELRTLDRQAETESDEIERLESEARALRRAVDEAGESRHKLELRQTQVEASIRSIHDRIEAEWGESYADLAESAEPAEGDVETLRAELDALAADLDRIGPVNLLAIEEYEEEHRRLEFLTTQRDDLARARDELETAIRQINRTARQLFEETFERVRQNFGLTFQTLFEGGECDIWLSDPDDPLESVVEISASPRGKRTQRIHQLSGGERALTALALVFAIYLVKPSPFCILDEVDAPLDEANIDRFLAMLQRFKAETQFVVITHNPRTMESADWIYGVTMQEPGVSSIVGVELADLVGADGA